MKKKKNAEKRFTALEGRGGNRVYIEEKKTMKRTMTKR